MLTLILIMVAIVAAIAAVVCVIKSVTNRGTTETHETIGAKLRKSIIGIIENDPGQPAWSREPYFVYVDGRVIMEKVDSIADIKIYSVIDPDGSISHRPVDVTGCDVYQIPLATINTLESAIFKDDVIDIEEANDIWRIFGIITKYSIDEFNTLMSGVYKILCRWYHNMEGVETLYATALCANLVDIKRVSEVLSPRLDAARKQDMEIMVELVEKLYKE